ncbi:hypothetical protein GCM10020219_020590 [Nonomuraea dietziae]
MGAWWWTGADEARMPCGAAVDQYAPAAAEERSEKTALFLRPPAGRRDQTVRELQSLRRDRGRARDGDSAAMTAWTQPLPVVRAHAIVAAYALSYPRAVTLVLVASTLEIGAGAEGVPRLCPSTTATEASDSSNRGRTASLSDVARSARSTALRVPLRPGVAPRVVTAALPLGTRTVICLLLRS